MDDNPVKKQKKDSDEETAGISLHQTGKEIDVNDSDADRAAEKSSTPALIEDEEDEKMCRFCFGDEKDGELISPCNCKGGQKYVHLECLRRWQRMVLVSQPTHPDYWEDDERHRLCNVCKAEFTCPPPQRGELVAGFTGPELAALIDKHCIIATREYFTQMIERQVAENPLVALASSCLHWIRGVFLITSVTEDDGTLTVAIHSAAELRSLSKNISNDGTVELRGKRFRLCAAGPLANKPVDALRDELLALSPPCAVTFRPVVAMSCSDDHVVAVNLAQPAKGTGLDKMRIRSEGIISSVRGASAIEVQYYLGGPVSENEIACCLVVGGRARGYVIRENLRSALQTALGFAAFAKREDCGGIAVGQHVRIKGLKKRPELNGQRGLVQCFDEASGRFEVRTFEKYEGVKVKPVNLEGLPEGSKGTVYVFYGHAAWSRAQLLSEIARGSWGLTKALTTDITTPAESRHAGCLKRLLYAPVTDMTEDYIRRAELEMQNSRDQRRQVENGEGAEAQPEEEQEETEHQ